jgi:hypothetical protein
MRRHLCALALAALAMVPAGTVRGHGIGPGGVVTGALSFADPAPGGISYEWTLIANRGEETSLVDAVSAKSWLEPMNPENLKGWTHTSQWVALQFDQDARIKITVEAQQGVVVNVTDGPQVARYGLVPALTFYRGWDDTTQFEDHAYNNAGNFWSTVVYMGHNSNPKSRSKITYKAKLPAGRYSMVIGGNPASLGDASQYPPSDCDPVDPLCYRYSGDHGYRMTIRVR